MCFRRMRLLRNITRVNGRWLGSGHVLLIGMWRWLACLAIRRTSQLAFSVSKLDHQARRITIRQLFVSAHVFLIFIVTFKVVFVLFIFLVAALPLVAA